MMAELFAVAGIAPEVPLKAKGLSELLGLVGGGAGVAIAPADLVHLPHSGIVFLPMKKPKRTLLFSAAWRPSIDHPEIEALVDLIKDR